MDRRIKIGLTFSYNDSWIGGTYYMINLIKALSILDEAIKPELVIISNKESDFKIIEEIRYPFIKYHLIEIKQPLLIRAINKIYRLVFKQNLFNKKMQPDVDILYWGDDSPYFDLIKQKLFWIADFQEHYLPAFFSKEELEYRKKRQKYLAEKGVPIVFSSLDAQKDFKTFYNSSSSPTFALNFAVTHSRISTKHKGNLLVKYNIDRPFYLVSNQFWAHKNHILVLKSIIDLKEAGFNNLLVVFTGKETDYRAPHHYAYLQNFIKENNIESFVKFLGFIDREDQLGLMQNSIAVIQPSLFEGWSTVVEDAKYFNKLVIASSLDVHYEQLGENGIYFDPENSKQLASILQKYLSMPPSEIDYDYPSKIRNFANGFIDIVKSRTQPTDPYI